MYSYKIHLGLHQLTWLYVSIDSKINIKTLTRICSTIKLRLQPKYRVALMRLLASNSSLYLSVLHYEMACKAHWTSAQNITDNGNRPIIACLILDICEIVLNYWWEGKKPFLILLKLKFNYMLNVSKGQSNYISEQLQTKKCNIDEYENNHWFSQYSTMILSYQLYKLRIGCEHMTRARIQFWQHANKNINKLSGISFYIFRIFMSYFYLFISIARPTLSNTGQ